MFGGKKLEDFTASLNAKDYNIEYTPDYSVRYITDKNGKAVFSEKTGAVLDKETDTYKYTYSFPSSANTIPTNKDEVATKLGISSEQIEAKFNTLTLQTEYHISHETKELRAEDIKKEVNRILKNANGGGETILDQINLFSKKDTSKSDNVFSTNGVKAALSDFEEKANKYQEDLKKSQEAEDRYSKDQTEKNKISKDESYKNAFISLNILASDLEKIGRYSNDKDLMKAGAVLGSFAGIGVSLSQLGVISGASQVVTGFATVFPAAALIAGALAIFSILGSDDDDNGLGEALKQIMDSLNIIRKEMHEQFYEVHKKLFQIYDLLYKHHFDTSIQLESTHKLLQFAIVEVSNLVKLDIFNDAHKILNNIKSKILPRDADKFRDNLEILDSCAREISKQDEFNGVKLRSDSILETDTQNQINSRQTPINNIAFFIKYAKEILKIEGLPEASSVPNFNVFYKTAQPLLKMLTQAIKYDSEVINLKEKLIDNKNQEYLKKILKELALENNKIHDTVTTLRNSDIIDKLIKNYKDALNDFSNYINITMEEHSDSLKKSEFGNEYSIFNPNYSEIYKVSTIRFSNHWDDCFITSKLSFTGEEVGYSRKTGFKSQNRCYEVLKSEFFPGKIIDQIFYGGIHHSRDYNVNVNSLLIDSAASREVMVAIKDKAHTKLAQFRNEFFSKLTMEEKYRKHVEKVGVYEKLIKIYGQIIGEVFPLNLTKNIHGHVLDLSKKPAGENIPKLSDYKSIIDDNKKIDEKYKEWKKSENPYKNYALHFKNMIEIAESFTSVIKENNAYNAQESTHNSAKEQDIPTPEKVDVKQNTQAAEKVNVKQDLDKAYLKLKSFFQEILELSDDIKNSLEGKKLDKFNSLFDKVQIEETFKDSPIPEGLNLEQLQDRYCEVHCVDKYTKFYVEFYRAGMRDDLNMEYLSGVIKGLNDGEVIACEC